MGKSMVQSNRRSNPAKKRKEEKKMKIVVYDGEKVRLLKGETLAIVSEFYGGTWARPEKSLCVIKKKYFKNGKEKSGDFDVVRCVRVIQKGYRYGNASYRGKNFREIATAEK